MKVRSKHNDLLNYFVHDKRDLSPAYVKKCEKFLKEISRKLQAPSVKRILDHGTSNKPQAPSRKRHNMALFR